MDSNEATDASEPMAIEAVAAATPETIAVSPIAMAPPFPLQSELPPMEMQFVR
jgi:hypothetical protein